LNEENIHIRPTVKNFGAVDLIVFPDKLFQITVSEKHNIKQNELIKIIEKMPAYKTGNKIRLYFVVPDDIYNDYTCQSYVKTRNKDNYQGDIDYNDPNEVMFRPVIYTSSVLESVEQWVLKIDLSL
jgi:hypothetical protein